MKEFRDSVTGKTDKDLDDDDGREQANAALGRSDDSPIEGEVVSDRERTRS
jgi:hypothetical protein